jgi:hypothetical protein
VTSPRNRGSAVRTGEPRERGTEQQRYASLSAFFFIVFFSCRIFLTFFPSFACYLLF